MKKKMLMLFIMIFVFSVSAFGYKRADINVFAGTEEETKSSDSIASVTTDYAFITWTVNTPNEEYSDKLYVTFQNRDNSHRFDVTLSQDNEYRIELAIPNGVYDVVNVAFASGSEEFCLNLGSIDISNDAVHTFTSDIVPYSEDLELDAYISVGQKGSSSLLADLGWVVAGCALIILVVNSVKNKKNKNKDDNMGESSVIASTASACAAVEASEYFTNDEIDALLGKKRRKKKSKDKELPIEVEVKKRRKLIGNVPSDINRFVPYVTDYDGGLMEISTNRFSKAFDFKAVCSGGNEKLIEAMWEKFMDDNSVDTELSYTLNYMQINGNDFVCELYVVATMECDNPIDAIKKFEVIENDILYALKDLGSVTVQNNDRRLEVFKNFYRPQDKTKKKVAWEVIRERCISSKDFIAPNAVECKETYIDFYDFSVRTVFLNNIPNDVKDAFLHDFIGQKIPCILTVTTKRADIDAIADTINEKVSESESQSSSDMEETERKASIYKECSYEENQTLVEKTIKNNQQMYYITVGIAMIAHSEEELNTYYEKIQSITKRHRCQLQEMRLQQKEALMQVLPFGHNVLLMKRTVMTSDLRSFRPF